MRVGCGGQVRCTWRWASLAGARPPSTETAGESGRRVKARLKSFNLPCGRNRLHRKSSAGERKGDWRRGAELILALWHRPRQWRGGMQTTCLTGAFGDVWGWWKNIEALFLPGPRPTPRLALPSPSRRACVHGG